MIKAGLIGGSGMYDFEGFQFREKKKCPTPYGEPSDEFYKAVYKDCEVYFLPRHGSSHTTPPHKINYRANLWAFKELGVNTIITIGAVGGIADTLKPGDLVIPDQIIDFTAETRSSTFFDGPEVVHIDFTEPYCEETRSTLIKAAASKNIKIHTKGTYAASQGPRLETSAEIKALKILGAHVVGMTGMPEAALARELGICFAMIAVVTNYAAGISRQKLTTTEVINVMNMSKEKVKTLIKESFSLLPQEKHCECRHYLADAKMN